MTDCDDLTDKMKELVVEEKTNEKNWNDLPDEMKEMVIKEMTIETRTRLKMCSKADKLLVDSMPLSYRELFFRAIKDGNNNLSVALEIHSKLSMLLEITAKRNEVEILRTFRPFTRLLEQDPKRIPCSSEEESKKLLENIIRSILFDGYLRFNKATVFIDVPGFLENVDFAIHTKHLVIDELNSQTVEWLKKVAPKVERVTAASDWFKVVIYKDLGTIPAIINASKLEILHECDINDEQLASFNCTSLTTGYRWKLTGKGMNGLIKKAVANDYPIGTHFEINQTYRSDLSVTWENVSEGLDIEITDSRDDSYDEYGHLDHGWRKGIIRMEQDKQMTIFFGYEMFDVTIC